MQIVVAPVQVQSTDLLTVLQQRLKCVRTIDPVAEQGELCQALIRQQILQHIRRVRSVLVAPVEIDAAAGERKQVAHQLDRSLVRQVAEAQLLEVIRSCGLLQHPFDVRILLGHSNAKQTANAADCVAVTEIRLHQAHRSELQQRVGLQIALLQALRQLLFRGFDR